MEAKVEPDLDGDGDGEEKGSDCDSACELQVIATFGVARYPLQFWPFARLLPPLVGLASLESTGCFRFR